MADYSAFFNNPLVMLGAGMMAGADPQREGLGGFGSAILNTGQAMRDQAQLEEENRRARAAADLQMEVFRNRIAQQQQQDLSKTPTYVLNPETGQYQMLQLSARGAPSVVPLPEGFEPVRPMTFQDVGPQILGFQQGMARPAVAVEKGVTPEAAPATRAAQATAVQEAQTTQEARERLPEVQSQAARTLRYIDELAAHPGLESATGLSSLLPVIPGTERAAFEARKEQLIGTAFLQAYEGLRGGGQITEIEGQKAEQSIARMQSALSREDFEAALQDFREIVQSGLERARKKAGIEKPREAGVVDWSEL